MKCDERRTWTPVWQSVIAECQFHRGELTALRLDPVTLKHDGVAVAAANPYKLDGNPRLAEGKEAVEILERVQALSKDVGTRIDIRGNHAEVRRWAESA